MKKEIVSWALQLMIVLVLSFLALELHALNQILRGYVDVKVSGADIPTHPVEVEMQK